MNNVLKKIFYGIMGILGLVLVFGSEGAYDSAFNFGGGGQSSITLSHLSWDDSLAGTHVITQVLEGEGIGVDLVQLDPAIMFSSVATGESDASVSPWTPATHGAFMERYGDQFEVLGPHTTGAVTGLVVPTYMEDVNSITDLTDEANKTITGIEPGAGIANQTEQAMEVYPNLSDWTHQTSSTGAMTTALRQAYGNQEEIIITGWNPHWKFIEFDLKYLEDPENVYGDGDEIITIAREGLQEDNPAAYQILDNFSWELQDMEQVMNDMQTMPVEEAAAKWISENPDKVAEWTEGVSAE